MKKGFTTIPIKELVKANWNYKNDSEELSAKLKANIKRNGQIENIIVRELDTGFFEVVNGNHRFDVLSELEFDKVHCFNLGPISQSMAMRIAIETNETQFESDSLQLGLRMKELVEEFGAMEILESMPFNDDELKNMLTINDLDFSEFEEAKPSDKKTKSVECPECGHSFNV